jgi:hypothetical protein
MTAILNGATGGRLAVSSRIEQRLSRGELTGAQVERYCGFLSEVDRELLQHRIIRDNEYTRWFQHGTATNAELRHFVRQFSVFSNQFLIAALLRVINAPTVDQSRAGKEILLNELGVIYRRPGAPTGGHNPLSDDDKDHEGDPELVSTEGTVDGGVFRFQAAHFEWLCGAAEALGLQYGDMGKRSHGRPSTLHFCDELQRLYGSADWQVAQGASFAVENWAAAGFWQELEDGLMHIKQTRLSKLRIAFFSWHNRVEAQHAGHTLEELEEVYFGADFSADRFFAGGREILDAIAVFWDGLNDDRHAGISGP